MTKRTERRPPSLLLTTQLLLALLPPVWCQSWQASGAELPSVVTGSQSWLSSSNLEWPASLLAAPEPTEDLRLAGPGNPSRWTVRGERHKRHQRNQQYFEVHPEAHYMVQNGADVRLRCLVRNRQGECLWLRNGRAIGSIARKYQFSRQPEDGDCSIQIRNASVQQDDGQWQCQVTASDVEQDTLQSREVQLIVLVAPERPQIKNMVSLAKRERERERQAASSYVA